MLKTISRVQLIGGWLLILGVMVAGSVATGAKISTSVLLLVLGISPVVVMWLLANHAAPLTIAEILYRAETTDRER